MEYWNTAEIREHRSLLSREEVSKCIYWIFNALLCLLHSLSSVLFLKKETLKESCIWPFGALPNQIWSFDECSPALCTSFFKAYYCMPTCNSRCPKNWNVTKLCLICCISFKPIVVHHPDIDICAKQEGVENLPIHPSLRLHSLKRLARLNERILSPFVTS